jgi:hypothetical protein
MDLMAHASTIREGIESLGRFYRLLTDEPFWKFVEDDSTGTIVFDAAVLVVQPATVFRWHREAWRHWVAFSLPPSGRPAADRRRVARPHPTDVA